MSPRVVVTGLGLLSPLGEGPEAHSEGFLAGRSAVGPLTLLDPGPFPFRAAGEVRDFVPRKHIDQRKSLKLMTRAVRLGMSAAHMAVEDSGLDPASVEPVRFGIFVGAPHAYGEPEDLLPALEVATKDGEFDLVAFGRAGLPIVNPLWLLKGLSNNVLGFTSLRYGAMGPNANLSGSGAGGAQAIGEGWRAIADGRADVALCGGYDSLVSVEGLTGYGRLGLLTTAERPPHTASRPFDAARDGFAPAEGGAFVMLETLDRAASRGARIYGEIVGAGDGADAFDPAAPDPRARGLVVAARSALRAAGASPADVAFQHSFAAESDADGDELSDGAEALYGTDPQNPDTDTAGLSDGAEILAETNPLTANSASSIPSLGPVQLVALAALLLALGLAGLGMKRRH